MTIRQLGPSAALPSGGRPAALPGARTSGPGAGQRSAQPVARMALRMTLVTVPGLETMERCGAPGTRVMWAWACLAIAISTAGGMTWSAVPMAAQDGIVAQAGTPDTWLSASVVSGSWVAARTLASLAGRPLAKQEGKRLCL